MGIYMKVRKSYVGQTFNKLTVVAEAMDRTSGSGQNKRYVQCLCDCGITKEMNLSNVTSGKAKSCGCLLSEVLQNPTRIRTKKIVEKEYEDLTGVVNGKLRVLSKFSWFEGCRRKKTRSWICVCECGAFNVLIEDRFKRNKSCGCERINTIKSHDEYKNPLYRTYHAMIQRCYNENNSKFYLYGGNGVTVCDRWLEKAPYGFLNFLEDMGEKPEGTSINRVNGAKVYSKETCSWDNLTVQSFDQLLTKPSKSGHVGILANECGTYSARISYKCKVISLGTFNTLEEALLKRKEAEIEYYGFAKQS